MNRIAVSLGAGWLKAACLAAVVCAGGLLAAGCRSSGVTVGTGINPEDEHGNTALTATVVIPDGRNLSGQINFPTDVDWFKFRGIQGVGYALQIHGFPRDPSVRPDMDLNGDFDENGNTVGVDSLEAQIFAFDGGTQLANSSGTQGGEAGDTAPAGIEAGGGFNVVGDSRFFWICPTTNDYFFTIRHRRNSIGAYRFRLGSSQLTTLGPPSTGSLSDGQTGQRSVLLIDDQGALLFSGDIAGGILSPEVEFVESLGSTIIRDFGFIISQLIFFPGDTTPQTPHIHGHVGWSNVFFPEASDNITDGDDDHPFFFDVALPVTRSVLDSDSRTLTSEGTMKLQDGTELRFPVTTQRVDSSGTPSDTGEYFKVLAHLDEAVGPRGVEVTVSAAQFRTIIGWPFYFDLHPQPSMDLDPLPITVSRPLADMYNMFETPLEADESNVILRDGSRPAADRGLPAFNIFYDTSLKLFQVATEIYQVGFGGAGIIPPDYEGFEGDRVRVHAGGPGETGPVLIDLGTLPSIRPPRSANPPFSENTVVEPEGFRQPIRQLTDNEAETLRDAFYDDGFYVEVTDRNTGEPLVRAEGFLGISFFPTLDPCDLPPCSGIAPASPAQRGTVTFALGMADSGPVNLYANGELLGSLNEPVTPDNLPSCGAEDDSRTLATKLWPGTYYWHANGKDGKIWDGYVTVTDGGCHLVVVTPDGA